MSTTAERTLAQWQARAPRASDPNDWVRDQVGAIVKLVEDYGPEDAAPLVEAKLQVIFLRGMAIGTNDTVRTMGLVDRVRAVARGEGG